MAQLYGLTARDKVRVGQAVSFTERHTATGQKFAVNQSTGGDTYNGHFKVTDTSTAEMDQVDIAAGKVINGTTVTNVPAVTALEVTDALYLSLEIWNNAGWFTDYLAEPNYPTQAKKTPGNYWAVRVLIASRLTTSDPWVRQICGEIHNTRLVD